MKQESKKWPITVEDHQEQGRIHAEKQSAVNAALKFPTGSAFDEDLGEILASDAEANGEVVAIALIDCDKFDHINKDFSREAGDNVLVSAGEYIRDNLPEGAKVYRIGGDEFGIIFRGTMEREEIFLFLNDLKNNYIVATPDGERQTVTIGMAKAEGWYNKTGSKWKTMPELMMRYRAATFLIRSVAPEIALGFQTTEEVRDIIDVTSQSQVVGTAPSLDEIAMAAVEETEQPTTTENNDPEPATEQTLFDNE
jgi:diguanylate cyclase (GGDEF)-like protein